MNSVNSAMRCSLFLILFLLLGGHYALAQSIIMQDGKCGLTDDKGSIVLKPIYDTIIAKKTMPTFFIVKNEGKFAYAYKVESDSLKWLADEERSWYISKFEFDSLYVRALAVDVVEDQSDILYAHVQYKVNGMWGLILIESHLQSGSGIFVSAGSYAGGLGKSMRRGAMYDAILGFELDGFYVTLLDGKYGLMNPGTKEEYAPEFDTIPVFRGRISYGSDYGRRERYVRKNGKWGVIQMDAKTKSIKYSAPCRCNEVTEVGENLYACTGSGDTITFFDTLKHTEYTPLVNGKPLIFSKDSLYINIYEYYFSGKEAKGPKPLILAVRNNNNPPPEKTAGYNQIYWIDPLHNRITAFNDSDSYYNVYRGTTRLVCQAKLHSASVEMQYNFYDLETKQFLFQLELDSNYLLRSDFYHPKKCTSQDAYSIAELYYFDKKDRKKVVGYYNGNNKRFTRRKPKCN